MISKNKPGYPYWVLSSIWKDINRDKPAVAAAEPAAETAPAAEEEPVTEGAPVAEAEKEPEMPVKKPERVLEEPVKPSIASAEETFDDFSEFLDGGKN